MRETKPAPFKSYICNQNSGKKSRLAFDFFWISRTVRAENVFGLRLREEVTAGISPEKDSLI
jgi:hypothetical protein